MSDLTWSLAVALDLRQRGTSGCAMEHFPKGSLPPKNIVRRAETIIRDSVAQPQSLASACVSISP